MPNHEEKDHAEMEEGPQDGEELEGFSFGPKKGGRRRRRKSRKKSKKRSKNKSAKKTKKKRRRKKKLNKFFALMLNHAQKIYYMIYVHTMHIMEPILRGISEKKSIKFAINLLKT